VRKGFAVLVGLVMLGGSVVLAAAQTQPPPQDTSPETVYATEPHMWFSIRVSLIRLLGGTPVVQPQDVERAQQERWWGEPVPTEPQRDKR